MANQHDARLIAVDKQTVDLWLCSPCPITEEQRRAYESLLSYMERERLVKFVSDSARDQFLFSHALLRTALSNYCDASPESWEFYVGSYGKPYIARPEAFRYLQFNISHTNGLVVCAVSGGVEIGVDVENLHRHIDLLSLSPQVFSLSETEILRSLKDIERRRRFFKLWTLKEAYIKARAMGLAIPLNSFEFEISTEIPRIYFSNPSMDIPEHWHFFQAFPTNAHSLALAVAAPCSTQVNVQIHWTMPVVQTNFVQQRA